MINQPDSSAGITAGRVVLQFAESSPDYRIQVSLCYLPWVGSRDLPQGSQMLLAAFVAGNLQERIRKRSSRPEPYAGARAIIEVCQKMSRKFPNPERSPTFGEATPVLSKTSRQRRQG